MPVVRLFGMILLGSGHSDVDTARRCRETALVVSTVATYETDIHMLKVESTSIFSIATIFEDYFD
jgi:hypothetical protein